MDYKEIIKELRGLANGSIEPIEPNLGICTHIRRKTKGTARVSLVCKTAEKWEKYSGKYDYPVPCPDGRSPIAKFNNSLPDEMWGGPYGELRRELCLFIADYLEANPND